MRTKRILLAALSFSFAFALPAAGAIKVGVGKAVITPERPIWLSGYAARKAPSDGKIHDLFAKALVFEDATGARAAIVTMDLLGLPAAMTKAIAETLREKHGLARERIIFAFSHTHSGPVIDGDRTIDMYGMDEANAAVVKEYAQKLPDLLVAAVAAAFKDLEPCRVEWGVGRAAFAANRRQRTPTSVTIGVNPTGPVDHDVPVMRIARASGGAAKAVLFGYACHNTTLSHQKICGDYAGYAQASLEGRMPGVTALFFAGCGADSNPSPRGTFELAEKHGKELADAVAAALAAPLTELGGPIRAAYEEISLALTPPPSRADLEKQLADQNIYIQRRARRLLATLDRKGAIPDRYSYPVQVWRLGDGLQLVALAGEVVVDYSLRLKQELGRERTWVMGYANDFCCYIPSLRVLREGGYEGGDSMVYFGIHGPWAPAVEEDVVKAVHRLVAAAK